MDEQILIKLLQMHFEHQRKLGEFTGKMNLGYLETDLLGLVLDAVGIPADNSLEQIGKYGYGEWLDRPDTFSRYGYYREFEKRVVQGSEAECQLYLENVILTSTFHHLINTNKSEPAVLTSPTTRPSLLDGAAAGPSR